MIDLSTAAWRKSSRSGGSGANCVEVARNLPDMVAVRDSEYPDGLALVVDCVAWQGFAAWVRER